MVDRMVLYGANPDGVCGTIKLQGTLAVEPVEADYFDIANVEYNSGTDGSTGPSVYNFTGNFVWVRVLWFTLMEQLTV